MAHRRLRRASGKTIQLIGVNGVAFSMDNVGLVTGASSGIGKELARIHASRNRDLVIVARREDELNALKEELESKHRIRVKVIAADLTEAGACEDIVAELKRDGIFVEYLFNNAGFGGRGLFHEQDWAMLSGMIALNITALTRLTHLLLPPMVSYGSGRVLNTSSTAGFMPGPLQAVYFATKAFVNSFSKAIASELDGTGVTATALCPGPVDTGFADTAGFNGGDMFDGAKSAKYTAQRGYEAMESGDLEVITEPGLKFFIKAGLPFTPARLAMAQVKKMQSN